MQPAFDSRPRQQAPLQAPNQRPRAHSRQGGRPRQASPTGAQARSARPVSPQAQRRSGQQGQPRQPVRGPQPPRRTANFEQARRKKLQRRRRFLFGVAIIGILVVGLVVFLLTRLFGKGEEDTPAVSTAPPAASLGEPAEAGVSVSLPEVDLPTLATGPYDEAGAPYLFNFENEISDEYTSTLLNGGMTGVGSGQQMEARAAEAYLAMTDAAKADGVNLVPLSGYRSNERQTSNYNASIDRYLAQGYSPDEAKRRTEGYYAIPGTSEHEAGLAMDIGDAAVPSSNIQDSFEKTEAFAWLQEHCTEYGFILRYREEDFNTTHIHYEPWHYRYVGANHAAAITKQGVTLEEYVQALG